MIEKIIINKKFTHKSNDGSVYECYMYKDSCKHYLHISKINKIKFLCFNIKYSEWSFNYFVNDIKITGIYEEGKIYHYNIDYIKTVLENGISFYYSKKLNEKDEELKIKNTIHKKEI